ncbi:MAG TPA: FAD:protein FMN transferase, partial [Gemmatimonadaceae bacterium]|nr:FAD:protein FMN transferase [Gemmatimonadaceae bacterium]
MSTITVALALALAAGSDSLSRFAWREVHLGMEVQLTGYAPNDSVARTAARAAFAEIARLEDVLSDWRPGSEVRRLEHRTGAWQEVSPELFAVLRLARDVARASGGAFDPTVGPLTVLWREARRAGVLPATTALRHARTTVGHRLLDLDTVGRRVRLARPGMRLDLGGVAKGFILQRALGVLAGHGVSRALVQAGGDLVAGDAPPGRDGWDVAAPLAIPRLAAVARALRYQALATSGPIEQFLDANGRRYSHVVDPRTGLGVTSPVVATVVADDAALADALATALTVLDEAPGRVLLRRFRVTGGTCRPAVPRTRTSHGT